MHEHECKPEEKNGRKTTISEGTKVTLRLVIQLLGLILTLVVLIIKMESAKDLIVSQIKDNRLAIEKNRTALDGVWTYQEQVLWTEKLRSMNPTNNYPTAKEIRELLLKLQPPF